MESVEEIISDVEIDAAWGSANFGDTSRREIIRNSLLKCASGFRTGHTAECILHELGLIYMSKWQLSKRGRIYLFAAYSNGVSV